MATKFETCTGAPPCFRHVGDGHEVDARAYPQMRGISEAASADFPELVLCRKLGDPGVNMSVRARDGSTRDMEPAERETVYCNRWFNRLKRRAHTMEVAGVMGECQMCLNCDHMVYLTSAHLRIIDDRPVFLSACRAFVCMSCTLRSAFRNRGFGLPPTCIFCRSEYDEEDLVPMCVDTSS